MALYTERTYEDLLRDQLAQQQAEQAKAMQAYNAQKNRVDQKYSGGLGGFLGDIVGGVGKFFGDIGQGVGGLIGTGVASAKDLIESAAEGKVTDRNTRDFKKDWYKAENDKDAAAKAAGTSLNAATNVASFIPGVGAGTAAGKVAGGVAANTAMGALGGFGDEFQQQGQDAQIDSAINRALAGGAAGLATGGLNRKLGNATSKVGSALLNNKVATSTLGRGALSGAVGGAVGAGTSAALGGGDVAQAALQGGLTGAAGGATQAGLMAGANKLGQKALGKINRNNLATSESEITQNVTEDEFRAYGDSALAKKTKRNQVSDALSRFGDTLEGAQTNVIRAAARDLGIDSTGKVVENVRKKTGLTNLETQAALAKELTGGADSLMDRVQKQALSATSDGKPFKVDASEIVRDVDQIIESNSTANDFGNESAKRRWAQNIKNDISSGATDVLTKSNKMKSAAAELRGKGIVSPSEGDSAKAKIYTEIANKLDKLSYSAIPKENINDMFDVTISEMRSRANQASNTGNDQIARAYNSLADNLAQQPRTIQAYRSFKKDFVDISKIDQLTARAENGAAQNLGQSASGIVKKIGNILLTRPVNSALAKAGGAVNSVADAISNIAPTNGTQTNTQTNTQTAPLSQNTQTMLGNIIGRTTGQQQASNAVQNARKAQEYQNLEDMLSNIQSTPQGLSGAQMGNTLSGYNAGSITQSSPLVGQLNDIANGMSLAIAAGDLSAYSQLADLYKTAYNIYQMQNELTSGNNASSSNTKLSKTQQQANAASISLDQLENMTPDFGYSVSSIPVLGNIVNAQGNQYESTAKSLAMQLGYMLSGANIKDNEAEAIGRAYVPQPFDSEATRQYKLQQARKIIQQYQNGYVTDDLSNLLASQ